MVEAPRSGSMTEIGLRINRVAFNAGFILVLGYAITRDIFGIPTASAPCFSASGRSCW